MMDRWTAYHSDSDGNVSGACRTVGLGPTVRHAESSFTAASISGSVTISQSKQLVSDCAPYTCWVITDLVVDDSIPCTLDFKRQWESGADPNSWGGGGHGIGKLHMIFFTVLG